MSQLVFPLTPQDTQQFDLLIDSSFSHEDRHLDQVQVDGNHLNQAHHDNNDCHLDQANINEQPH